MNVSEAQRSIKAICSSPPLKPTTRPDKEMPALVLVDGQRRGYGWKGTSR